MQEALPNMWITPDVDVQSFLARLEEVATTSGSYQVDIQRNLDGQTGWDVLNITPLALNTPHVELFGQAISQPGWHHPIRVEVRAHLWSPEATYASYVGAGRMIFGPLLQAYNRKYRTRLHLYAQSKADLEPKLPPTVAEAFKHFLGLANLSMLHPLDWERFYDFVILSHRVRYDVGEQNLVRLLVDAGCNEEYAWDIANVYNHLYEILDRV